MSKTKERGHAWEQWDWVWHTAAYGLMTLNLAIASNNSERSGSFNSVTVATLALALWYLPFLFVPSKLWARRVFPAVFYFAPGWLIWLALIRLHSPSMMLAAFFYPQLFLRMPFRWALVSAGIFTATSFYTGFILNGDPEALPTLWLIGFLLLASQTILSGFINALIAQSNGRYELLEELNRTRAELSRAEREAGILAERQRLAREIHDTLAQDFTSIVMHLNAAKLNATGSIQHINQAEQTAREGLNEARHLVWALQPERASLSQSIETLASRWSAENSIRVNISLMGSPKVLLPEKEAALFRVAQEALTNIKKHAHAHQVDITLTYMTDLIALDILDDGIGFDPAKIQPTIESGFGLKAMRERLEELGGTLTIEAGNGTALAASLPMEEET